MNDSPETDSRPGSAGTGKEVSDALDVARYLAKCGVPLFIAKPARNRTTGEWLPKGGSGGCGYWLPEGWQQSVADVSVVDRWEKGDALCAVMGHLLDGVDTDPRSGGEEGRAELESMVPRVWAKAATPSGGTHEYVAAMNVRSLDKAFTGVDIKAGTSEGLGRGLMFLPPTRRKSKVDGKVRAYTWEVAPDLEELLMIVDMLGSEPSTARLTEHVLSRGGSKAATEVMATADRGPDAGDLAPWQREYAEAYVESREAYWRDAFLEALELPEGVADENDRGWEALCRNFAWDLGLLVNSPWTGLGEESATAMYERVVPDEIENDPKCGGKFGPGVVAKVAAEGAYQPVPWPDFGDVEVVAAGARESEHDPFAVLTGHVTQWLGKRAEKPIPKWFAESKSPNDLADQLLKFRWTKRDHEGDSCLVLRTWLGRPYEWHTTHWEPIPPGHLEAEVLRHLSRAQVEKVPKGGGKPQKVPLKPTPSMVANVVKMIEHKSLVHALLPSGHWIDCTTGRCPVGQADRRYLSFTNGLLDLDTNDLDSHESAFFNTYAMRFAYDPDAKAPLWEETLEQWFPGDPESQNTLEEIMGYLVLGGMEMDKIFPFLGPTRGGKGTVMRVLHYMLGSAFTAQSLHELGDRFGKEDLIGKRVVHITEAVGGQGARAVVSLMKAISGQDDGNTVKIKGGKSVQVDFECRFCLTGNEEVELPDDSGTIIDRLVCVKFGQSFLGKENPNLTKELLAESAGIFNRIRVAYDRLMDRGKFVQPQSAVEMLDRLREKASPRESWWRSTFEVTGKRDDYVLFEEAVQRYLREAMDSGNMSLSSAQKIVSGMAKDKSGCGVDRPTLLDPKGIGPAKKTRVIYGVVFREPDEDPAEHDD